MFFFSKNENENLQNDTLKKETGKKVYQNIERVFLIIDYLKKNSSKEKPVKEIELINKLNECSDKDVQQSTVKKLCEIIEAINTKYSDLFPYKIYKSKTEIKNSYYYLEYKDLTKSDKKKLIKAINLSNEFSRNEENKLLFKLIPELENKYMKAEFLNLVDKNRKPTIKISDKVEKNDELLRQAMANNYRVKIVANSNMEYSGFIRDISYRRDTNIIYELFIPERLINRRETISLFEIDDVQILYEQMNCFDEETKRNFYKASSNKITISFDSKYEDTIQMIYKEELSFINRYNRDICDKSIDYPFTYVTNYKAYNLNADCAVKNFDSKKECNDFIASISSGGKLYTRVYMTITVDKQLFKQLVFKYFYLDYIRIEDKSIREDIYTIASRIANSNKK